MIYYWWHYSYSNHFSDEWDLQFLLTGYDIKRQNSWSSLLTSLRQEHAQVSLEGCFHHRSLVLAFPCSSSSLSAAYSLHSLLWIVSCFIQICLSWLFHFLLEVCLYFSDHFFHNLSSVSLLIMIIPSISFLPSSLFLFINHCFFVFLLAFFSFSLLLFPLFYTFLCRRWEWDIGSAPPSFYQLFLTFPPHLPPSIFLLQCALKQALCCLMTWISSDCWEEIDL